MFLSIIIPVYNGTKTINRCLDSIWSQGLPDNDYEVICVDDCSSDGSYESIVNIAKHHPQLKVLKNNINLRAGGARNHGVRHAQGEYILFIDADDYFHPHSLRHAFRHLIDSDLDILMCDFARHKDNMPNEELIHKFPSTAVMTGRQFLVVNSLPYAPWKYLFKRNLMIDNNVYFAERVSCEDVDWSHKIALFATKMQYQPILLTHYILFETSQTGREYKNTTTVFYRLMAGKRVTELIPLCYTPEEQMRIKAVAQETLLYGVIFLCGLASSPKKKSLILKDCIDEKYNWRKELRFVRKNPYLYGLFSTLISPLFRFILFLKRSSFGR